MWKVGILRRLAGNTARQLLVSPRTSSASGCSTALVASTASGACAPTAAARVTTVVPVTAGAARPGSAAATAGGAATLARTGADTRGLATTGALSGVLGGVLLALGRRRKPRLEA